MLEMGLVASESQKNDRVYRGVVKTPFRQSSAENPSFYSRTDILRMVPLISYPDTESALAGFKSNEDKKDGKISVVNTSAKWSGVDRWR